jgi:hypothetical protein
VTGEVHQVTALSNSDARPHRSAFYASGIAMLCAALLAASVARPDEPLSDSIGVIDGEAVSVTGPMSIEVVNGQTKTVLRSGSDVRVKSGAARIDLIEGGQISICGPAHLSLLKSGAPLTIALDTGTVHVHIERDVPLTIYTPLIQAQTVAIGDGPRDALVGFDSSGAMCIRANLGAIRVEQQLTGQSVLVPQTGDIFLFNGQLEHLRASAGHCACELQLAKAAPPPQPIVSQPEIADLPPSKDEPIYQIFMPPLVYDAKVKVQPEFDPRMIVLVRRVRVRPALIFQGRVEGVAVAAVTHPPVPTPAASANGAKPGAPGGDSFVNRVRTFVRKLWPSGS